jgi:hypothetical protein
MDRVKEITNSVISKFVARGDDLKSLKSKSDGLGNVSDMFKKKAKETKEEGQRKNLKVSIRTHCFREYEILMIAAGYSVLALLAICSCDLHWPDSPILDVGGEPHSTSFTKSTARNSTAAGTSTWWKSFSSSWATTNYLLLLSDVRTTAQPTSKQRQPSSFPILLIRITFRHNTLSLVISNKYTKTVKNIHLQS